MGSEEVFSLGSVALYSDAVLLNIFASAEVFHHIAS